ncbi:MAG: T9SS type A sorting domain-containing protein [Bacteroidia bacterium]
MKKIFITCSAFFISFNVFAQSTAFIRDSTIPLYQSGVLMPLAYSGGINDGMFSEIDLNGDGIKDLFVFEKDQAYKKARITTYINNGTANQVDYVYAPQYISHFPEKISDWAILVDYNCDGKEDLLTYSNVLIPSPAGVTAYKNVSTPGNLQFQLDYPLIYANTPSGTINLYVSSVDKPAFVDEDGDGDLDAFSLSVGGGTVARYKNLAEETLGRCDTFVMEWQQHCWGNFSITYTNTANLGLMCKAAPYDTTSKDSLIYPNKNNNDGYACITLRDFDGSGTLDYMSGDPARDNLLLVLNGGTPTAANMTAQDTTFPKYDTWAMYYTFLDPSFVDVNNDGLKDMLVSPCATGHAENYHSVWYYKNVGTATVDSFSFQTDNLLINQMADVGEGAKVCFFDADADGLMDLMVGNRGYFDTLVAGNPAYQSGIAFYKNTGTATNPIFDLQNIDWMNLFAVPIISKHPTFGDLDNDGDADMIVGEESGHLYYFENTGGLGNPAVFTTPPIANLQAIDVGKFAAPQLFDANKDGLLDLIVGTELGKLQYFENTGTPTSFSFTLMSSFFGGVNVTQGLGVTGRASPFFYRDSLNNTKALVSNEHGSIFYYDNIDGNLAGNFNLIDTAYKGISEPIYATVSGNDINGDGLMDLAVGNQAGGFTFYKQVINTGVSEINANDNACLMYPVPAKNQITIKLKEDMDFKKITVTVYDNTGRQVYEKKMTEYYHVINLQDWSSGIYFCKITDINTGIFINKKFIVSK